MPAADVAFTIDIDSNTNEEMVTVSESKPARRQGNRSLLDRCIVTYFNFHKTYTRTSHSQGT